jgi:PAS domain S-box-containing protein
VRWRHGVVLRAEAREQSTARELEGRGGEGTWLEGQNGMEEREAELRQLKEALRQSDERFRMISHATDDAIWDWDLATGRLWWGENFYTNFQYTPEEVEPGIESWTRRIHPDDVARVVESIHQCLDSGRQKWRDEYRFVAKDGQYRSILDRGYIQRDGAGKAVRMVGAMVDTTARRKIEVERQRISAELDQRVVLRTREIAAAKEALEAFSYSVSHDLRAPLRHITGFLQLLARNNLQRLDEDGKRYLAIVMEAAQKMADLIEALLTFSRLGQGDLLVGKVDAGALVREVIQDFEIELKERTVHWKVHPLPEVEADGVLLRQVFVNLIGNALKYTRLREVAEIEIGTLVKPGEHLFFIRDNGEGFDMKYAAKLFCVFQRLHSEHEFEGHGIGLANVKRIVMRHGGNVSAEGEVGRGATFYFSLPVKPERPAGEDQH